METILIFPGAIYVVPDQATKSMPRNPNKVHPYILLGSKPSYSSDKGKKVLVQAMGITSLAGKASGEEIPLQMSNNTVGYITPWNIYSFEMDELEPYNFKGIVSDTDEYTRAGFIKFLLRQYQLHLGLISGDEAENARSEYSEYVNKFWDKNRCPEFRTLKESAPVVTPIKQITDDLFKNDTTNEVAINTVSSETAATSEVFQSTDIGNNRYSVEPADIPIIKLEDLNKLNNAGYKISQWSDENIMLCIYASRMFSYNEIAFHCLRWNDEDAYLKSLKIVYKTALIRDLIKDSIETFAVKDLSERSENEIKFFISWSNKASKKDLRSVCFMPTDRTVASYLTKVKMHLSKIRKATKKNN